MCEKPKTKNSGNSFLILKKRWCSSIPGVHHEAKKFIRVYFPHKLSDNNTYSLSYKLIDEKVGKFLFNNALGGSLGFFSSKINIRKKKQIITNPIRGMIRIVLFIF